MRSTSATSSSAGRETSRPRVDGTMQYEQTLLQPTEICTHPWCSRARFSGSRPVKPSNSKYPWAVSESLVRNSASLCTCPGPKATSTNGKRRKTSSLTDWAQQPPTPMTRAGSRRLSARASPRWATNRSSAFSRIEHVLKRMRSASARASASAYPSDSSMPFIRSESCSFIWHPKVVTWYRFTGLKLARALLRVLDRARLPDDGHLDLTGEIELLLDLAGDLVREQRGGVVVELARRDHDADLAPGLHRVDLVHAGVAGGDLLELPQPRDVVLERLPAGARASARERVGRLHDHRLDRLGLDLVVVGLHRVRDRLGLAVAARELAADQGVRALDFVGDRLADVVQQRRAARGLGAGAELLGHHRGEVGALDRVGEHVLPVRGPEAQAPEHLAQLGVDRAGVGVEHRLLAELGDVTVELGLGLVVGLLDTGRMDAPVLKQLLECHARELAADAVEAREHDRARRVVDDEVDAGEILEGADVAALPADDAALHVIGGQVDNRHRRLGRVARRHALHAHGEDVADTALGVALGLLLDLADDAGRVVARALLDLGQQDLLGLGDAEAGDALELAQVLLLALVEQLALAVELARAVVERALALLELGHLGLERALAREQALLGAAELGAALAQLGLGVGGACRGRRARRCGRGMRIAHGRGGGDGRDRACGAPAAGEQGGGGPGPRQHGRRDHDLHVRSSPRQPSGPGSQVFGCGASDRAARGFAVSERGGAQSRAASAGG